MRRTSSWLCALALVGCGAGNTDDAGGGGGGAASAVSSQMVSQSATGGTFAATGGAPPCVHQCSSDFHNILDCNGGVVEACAGTDGCNPLTLSCSNACDNAAETKQSVGCGYYAVDMEQQDPSDCFAAFISNTWSTPAAIEVELGGEPLDVAAFTRIPQGQGPSLTYQPFDAALGVPPGQVAILFLSGTTEAGGQVACPVQPAVSPSAGVQGTGVGPAFRISSDVPVVAYQINPYGGGDAAVTGASLLLPTSAWHTNYIAVNAAPFDLYAPSMNVVATEDDTTVTLLPTVAVEGGEGVPSGPAGAPLTFVLDRGEHAQLTQAADLSGSVIEADKPVGLLAGHPCMRWPTGVPFCDHGEQMIPPVRALGSEYVSVMHRPRGDEPAFYRLVGAVDGTQLEYSSDVGGPSTLQRGEQVYFSTTQPFVLRSQDDDHPFLLFTYMTGSGYSQATSGKGDPDFVLNVPVAQYMSSYVFFADPTYPETNLVLVRSRQGGAFHDVELDCSGVVTDWQPLGDYEWTRVDLMTGDFQGVNGCSTGRHQIRSDGPFGLWIWGWGTSATTPSTANVSYGYPAGMNLQFINDVVVPPVPR